MIQSQVNTELLLSSSWLLISPKFSCCSVFTCGNLSSQPLNDDFLGDNKRAVILQGGAGFDLFLLHTNFQNVHFSPASTCYNQTKFEGGIQND